MLGLVKTEVDTPLLLEKALKTQQGRVLLFESVFFFFQSKLVPDSESVSGNTSFPPALLAWLLI